MGNQDLANRTEIVEVIAISGLDKVLAYKIPSHCRGSVQVGSLVRIPLRHRRELGIVTRFGTDQKVPLEKLKLIIESVQPYPVLSPDLMQLCRWAQRYYSVNAEAILEAIIPAAIRKGMQAKTRRYLSIRQMPDSEAISALEKRAPKQAALLRHIQQQSRPVARADTIKQMKVSGSVCDRLVEKGFLNDEAAEEERVAYEDGLGRAEAVKETVAHELTMEQLQCVESVHGALEQNQFNVRLLHGVTGSGKTEVYLRAIEKVVADKGGVVFLVPEVALAPQTVGRVRGRLEARGVRTVVWHSHLSEGERYDAWKALVSGAANVVVGARSAVFAPVQNLKLIIVDEEHEPAYKQEESPRYNGRDVAVYRAFLNDAVCLLGSATPSLESLYNVERGKYALDRMVRRVDNRELPKIHVVDMCREGSPEKPELLISRMLTDKLIDRYEKREQSILFLNRRGFSTSLLCPDCGYVAGCPHCSIPKTYHRTDGRLRCHLCGEEEPAPFSCPECKSTNIRMRGKGTQKIEDSVQKILPNARIYRMDADSMAQKNRYREILNNFRVGKIDILVGTQMIAKGLDFPNVTLVGLIDADRSLHIEDFRASERTFQLIVQVSGRAGRGDRAGEVVIQTHTPHAAPIQFARKADFDGFQMEELEQRREFQYPPFRHLIRHLFKGRNPDKVRFYIEQWARVVEQELGSKIEIRGPAPAPVEKIRDEYRFQLWYFMPAVSSVVGRLAELRESFKLDKEVIEQMDIDPMHLS